MFCSTIVFLIVMENNRKEGRKVMVYGFERRKIYLQIFSPPSVRPNASLVNPTELVDADIKCPSHNHIGIMVIAILVCNVIATDQGDTIE